jgi:hypothetical protein
MKMAIRKQKAEEFTQLLPALAVNSDFVTVIPSDDLSIKGFETVIHKHAMALYCLSLCKISF